jgi:ribosomal-protein-alanine N-acetyltransferase
MIAERLEAMRLQMETGSALNLLVCSKVDDELIGDCHFTNIVRGPFQACHLGFSIAQSHQGLGLMRECLASAIEYVFCELRLHRIMANYRPENERSARLLSGLGFEREGFARAYLKINGVWADHVLMSLVNQAEV